MIINKLIENNLDIKFITRIEILAHEAGHNSASCIFSFRTKLQILPNWIAKQWKRKSIPYGKKYNRNY